MLSVCTQILPGTTPTTVTPIPTLKQTCTRNRTFPDERTSDTLSMTTVWLDVGADTDLEPGDMKRLDIGREPVLLSNVEGTIVAVADTCTHEDASLSGGALNGVFVRCPLHGSRFCLLDGKAVDDPAEIDLEIFSVKIEHGRILIQVQS
ncbi:MAG TPA: non-heme iron oxygenase ferredoxin subunit [Gammaproteobacteria bacterium]|nr:non-heme iron oxygenase ferredoxin subunit [Gammaproteobacteria bacterium]HIM97922.1 non-heme iron oxygenase ferredoxin subunit [Gammaproteobacteria bacterium]